MEEWLNMAVQCTIQRQKMLQSQELAKRTEFPYPESEQLNE